MGSQVREARFHRKTGLMLASDPWNEKEHEFLKTCFTIKNNNHKKIRDKNNAETADIFTI